MGESKLRTENKNNMQMKHSDKGIRVMILTACLLLFTSLTGKAQQGLILETAMEIAENNSPSIKKTRLSLVRSQENLNAQNAALKTSLSLSVNPIGYSHNRSFNDLISEWNSTRTTESYGLFTVSQPVVLTDARISLVNRFGYKDSYSEYTNNTNKGFSSQADVTVEPEKVAKVTLELVRNK